MPSSPHAGRTVLLIDDNPAIFEMYRDVLPDMTGYTILTAENGVQALEIVFERCQSLPDCIVIDIMMPELDGVHLVRALRGDPLTADIPLVILTALAQERDRFVGLASGADRYLTKPIDVHTLVAAIEEAMTISEATRQQRLVELAESPESDTPDPYSLG
jgi:CheY-like chemotaxis protein